MLLLGFEKLFQDFLKSFTFCFASNIFSSHYFLFICLGYGLIVYHLIIMFICLKMASTGMGFLNVIVCSVAWCLCLGVNSKFFSILHQNHEWFLCLRIFFFDYVSTHQTTFEKNSLNDPIL